MPIYFLPLVLSTIFLGLKVVTDNITIADLLAVINSLDEIIQRQCLSE
ncbi:MAG: hypothetical protein ACREX4_00365 [Gammaproteobacteria bacterium]